MDIVMSGASGWIGTAAVRYLQERGHRVRRLVRTRETGEDEIAWDPAQGHLEPSRLEGSDALICLSGESIDQRWSMSVKERIRSSRIDTLSLLANTVCKLDRAPKVIVSASAIGYYGTSSGDALCTEEASPGQDFLARICAEWEEAARPVEKIGVRTVQLRFGVVLAPGGGALRRMLLPFKLGLGGPLGNGTQIMSWLTLDDAVQIIEFAMTHSQLKGPVNAVSPNPVSNREFAKALGRILHRPAFLPLPAPLIRLIFGEMGDALLLSSTRVVPEKLLEAGYLFRDPELIASFHRMLSK